MEATNTNQATGQPRRNKRWEDNHAAITGAYLKLISDLNRIPTIDEIREEMARPADAKDPNKTVHKAGRDTICKHLQEIEFKPIESPLRVLTDQVLLNIFKLSKRSAASQKLWFQLLEGWKEGTEISGPNGAPLVPDQYDYEKLSAAELMQLIELTEKAKVNNAASPKPE